MSDMEQYAQYFTLGLKITVCIPMDNNELFRDWAIVEALEGNLLTLRLSRDELPVEVHLIAGTKLDLRLVKDKTGLRCDGSFAGYVASGIIQVYLSGDVSSSELREFFRIDAFLPFRYQFTEEQNLDVLIGSWRRRKQLGLVDEAERRDAFNERQRDRVLKAAAGELSAEDLGQGIKSRDVEEFNPIDETWNNVNATSINLSAGGFKFVSSEVFKVGEYVVIEMFLPATPPRIMESITRVVFINNNYSFKDGKEFFNVALSFVIIDDRDRDAIVSHISHLESLRIRQKRYLPASKTNSSKNPVSPLRMAIRVALLVTFIIFIAAYFYDYIRRNEHNEIGDMFGNAVRKYREQTGQKW
jgi:hypothetical protein